jgi:hypothetical protein
MKNVMWRLCLFGPLVHTLKLWNHLSCVYDLLYEEILIK